MKDFMKSEPGVPAVVDRDTFQVELDALRVREKAHTREGDAIAAARRRLPMVEVDATTTLIGERGALTLLDAFEGRRMLIAYYFMWHTAARRRSSARVAPCIRPRSANCPSCIPVVSLTPRSARVRTKKVFGTATLWVGICLGTQPRTRSTLSWLGAGRA